jgi:hypothetical protein
MQVLGYWSSVWPAVRDTPYVLVGSADQSFVVGIAAIATATLGSGVPRRSVTTRRRLRTMLLALGALAVAFATFVLIGIINNRG